MIEEEQLKTQATLNISKPFFDNLSSLELLDREDLLAMVKKMVSGGVVLSFHGKRTAQEVEKKVRPRQTRVLNQFCMGTPEEQARNMIVEGENLQAMVTLYQYRNQVDLIVTDPPYNTGQHFRYNDRWDTDPNDPDLGTLVSFEDGSRHTKWMKAMMPRLNMMRAMLKPGGVIAICIDDNELFHLGMMMDEVFKEENRIAIINWQKSYSPKNDTGGERGGVSSATEYVLVYTKDISQAKTGLFHRTGAMNARYRNPDNDPNGDWTSGDASGPSAATHRKMVYGIQSPFTGQIFYPAEGRCWGFDKKQMKKWLEDWQVEYEDRWINDGNEFIDSDGKKHKIGALVIKGTQHAGADILAEAKRRASEKLRSGVWSQLYFTDGGSGGPRIKRYLKDVKQGKVPMTYWADEEYDLPLVLGTQSWNHTESGHSQTGINELDAIIGKGHGFQTVKPLKLFKKLFENHVGLSRRSIKRVIAM